MCFRREIILIRSAAFPGRAGSARCHAGIWDRKLGSSDTVPFTTHLLNSSSPQSFYRRVTLFLLVNPSAFTSLTCPKRAPEAKKEDEAGRPKLFAGLILHATRQGNGKGASFIHAGNPASIDGAENMFP